jgi:GxxExxY protein
LLETVYEVALAYELRLASQRAATSPGSIVTVTWFLMKASAPIFLWSVIVELKSIEALGKVHSKQVLTQLRLGGKRLGLLINFGEMHLKNGIERIVNGLPDEPRSGFGAKLLSFFASFASFA